jgi:VanZ family protein
MSPARLRLTSAVATSAVGLVILVTTLSPQGAPTAATFGLDDLQAHFLLFAALGAGAAPGFAASDLARRSPRRALLMTLLAFWIFAALTELGQGPVEGRDPSLSDWLADMSGALVGFLGGSVLLRLLLAGER